MYEILKKLILVGLISKPNLIIKTFFKFHNTLLAKLNLIKKNSNYNKILKAQKLKKIKEIKFKFHKANW